MKLHNKRIGLLIDVTIVEWNGMLQLLNIEKEQNRFFNRKRTKNDDFYLFFSNIKNY